MVRLTPKCDSLQWMRIARIVASCEWNENIHHLQIYRTDIAAMHGHGQTQHTFNEEFQWNAFRFCRRKEEKWNEITSDGVFYVAKQTLRFTVPETEFCYLYSILCV